MSKQITINDLMAIQEVAEEITPWAASKIVAEAIREHTRAMIAVQFRIDKTNIDEKAWDLADSFLAMGKYKAKTA